MEIKNYLNIIILSVVLHFQFILNKTKETKNNKIVLKAYEGLYPALGVSCWKRGRGVRL
jgi:hypothetical protein